MSRFLQLHLLSFVPPANLNRDDIGRPKTAVVGGATRLRISSQALKRAWRTSSVFTSALEGHMGQRTQRFGEVIRDRLITDGVPEADAVAIARQIVQFFGTPKDKPKSGGDFDPTHTEELAFIAPEEREAALAFARRLARGEKLTVKPEDVLRRSDTAADIAMFGRMLAKNHPFAREAAVQVAHAFTTHRVIVEDDYYVAVDDLKTPAENAGAGFLGETAFGSGVFYLYLSVNRALLTENLGGDRDLAATALGALAEAAATVFPRGKQNSFAAHGRAHYILAESGDQQPCTLAGAFIRPVDGSDLMAASVAALKAFRADLEKAYGRGYDAEAAMEVGAGGSLGDIVAFCRG